MTLWGPPRRVFVAAVACALAACVVVAAPTTVNIHVKLSPSVDAAATAANAFVQVCRCVRVCVYGRVVARHVAFPGPPRAGA